MDALADHLAARYDVAVERVVALDQDVYRVVGPGWVARLFPSESHDAVAATADLLRRLAPTKIPAERLGGEEPVSVCGGRPVLITEWVEGKRAPGTPRMFAALGAWLGGLHKQPGKDLPPGGGWHHLVAQGSPGEEIAAARALLEAADTDPAARQTLLAELNDLDDCADLPHGLVHPDFVPANTILRPEHGMVVIDWAGSGRGPRLWSLGFLLWAAASRDLALVETVLSRYRQHVQLSTAELDRLPDAIRGRPLTIDCWSVARGRLTGAEAVQRLDHRADLAEQVAARARDMLRAHVTEVSTRGDWSPTLDGQPADGAGGPEVLPESSCADPTAGQIVTDTLDYDGGRQVTVYVPPDPPEAIVFAADGQGISPWGALLAAADVPSTMIVGVHGLTDETLRLQEYSPVFDAERFAAHEKFFVEDVRRWVPSRFGVTLPTERTAVFGASAGGELALALGLRHPDVYGAVLSGSPGAGFKPTGVTPGRIPRTYLVAGTLEPFFLDNATRWAVALRDAVVDVVMSERVASHGHALWRAEFPLMVAWAFGRRSIPA
jgi:Ser/Thr protein kinase RdoA (MazF antagonist)/pimeloyl-ACP methyl ester carboxylesterase